MAAKPDKHADLVGDEPAIAGTARRAPDRREVSLRWLTGTFLTGLTSTALMGAALFAALDGKQFLATPPEVASRAALAGPDEGTGAKTGRLAGTSVRAAQPPSDRRRMSVSTVTRTSEADVIRTRPFEHLSTRLAAARSVEADYPAFNPLAIFSEPGLADAEEEPSARSLIYGARIETGASIRMREFVFDGERTYDTAFEISLWEAEETVRAKAHILTEGTIEVASLHYVDPRRFGLNNPLLEGIATTGGQARIVPQNVSVAGRDQSGFEMTYAEDLIETHETTDLALLMEATGYRGAAAMANALATLLDATALRGGYAIRLGLVGDGTAETERIMRATIYSERDHVLTVALDDQGRFVPAPEPVDRGIMRYARASEPAPAPRDLPSVYDAIYQGVLDYGLPETVAAQIVRLVAADVDFRSPVGAGDTLELFYSLPEEGDDEQPREILFVHAAFGGQSHKFYRFRNAEGSYDYYDEEGRSARQFLLRNPVPNGIFRSGFGMRRHPILGYSRMHWGADWAAPRGTPIIAPGDGIVIRAGWNSGYGKQTVIRHANGYETSYSHQTRFAQGIAAGARVRQGQVIGYVGSTGLSTGPHLHYEVSVNGKRVDPMRVRLPDSRSLSGDELAAFIRERDRINALLEIDLDDTTQLANIDG